jgi:two-component system CheB/CheR fusion protein
LVRRLVEAHGGSVHAFSAGLNQGSEFIVRVPLLTDEPSPSTGGGLNEHADTSCSKLRVLIVDDDRDVSESTAEVLRLAGFEVSTSHNSRTALQAVPSFRPNVVLLDIGMPEMDGYEVARRLRATVWGERLVLIAVSGYGQEEDRERSRKAGFDRHLVKPVRSFDLSCQIEFLRSSRNLNQR